MPDQKTFVVVARSRGSAIVYPGKEFSANIRIANGSQPLVFRFATTYENKGFEDPLPVDFWVEVGGHARDVHQAGEIFGNAARQLTACIALVANANMGSLDPHLIIDVTVGETEHEFLQTFLPDSPVTLVPGRRIQGSLVLGFFKALGPAPDHDRITRAASAYDQALQYWEPGHEIICLEYLYIGIMHNQGGATQASASEWQE